MKMGAQPDQAARIFDAAVELGSPAERAAYLDAACGQDRPLRAEVEELLEHDALAGSFLNRPARPALQATSDEPISERPGTLIGPYKLREQIGEGGMGLVFVAEQQQPVCRKVALKVLKPGMDTRQVVARFEAERQALALMDHPHIARVFDGGTTPAGRPYFVMELVKGLPITDYCDRNGLPVRERLGLFVDVCSAVQHAHQKGVIHRDLKPSNVLVVSHDGTPVAKVIDFGIAKAVGQHLTDKTIYTQLAQLIGTPLYMSPEQAGQSGLDVDTRADIYSLGVLLYELLTGTTPFDQERLRQAGFDELRRIIREEEPPKPSTRLSTLGQAATTVCTNRKSDPRQLSRLCRGELDWIVMKALDKDRNRRYETANAFVADVQRYLADEPVQACPPSAWYRLRKLARRNRGGLAAAAVLGVALLVAVGAVAGSIGWAARDREARQARLTGQVELILEDVDRLEDEQKWPEAQVAAERAETALAGGEADDALRQRVGELRRDLEFVARLDRIRQGGATIFGLELKFRQVVADYATAFRDYGIDLEALPTPEAAARLRARPALTLPVAAALDHWVDARRNLREHEATWEPLVAVARAIDPDPLRGRLRATWGRKVTPELQAELRRLAESIDVKAQSSATLATLAETLTKAGLPDTALQVLRDGQQAHPADFWLNYDLGWVLWERKDYAESARSFTAAVSLRPDSAFAHDSLGSALWAQRKLAEAVAQYRRAIELAPKYDSAHSNLGNALRDQGKLEEAVAECRTAIELDPKSALAHGNLGLALHDQGKLDEAIAEYHKAIELDSKYARLHSGLGAVLATQGKLDEAIAEYRKAMALDPKDAWTHSSLGNALRAQGKLEEAVAEYRKAIALAPKVAQPHNNLGNALYAQGKLDKAVAELQKAIELDPKVAQAHSSLGNMLLRQKKTDEAIIELRNAIALDPKDAIAHSNLGIAVCEQGKLDEGIAELRKAIALDPSFAKGHYNLGNALHDQGKLDEAIAEYHKTIELDPKYARPHSNLGVVLVTQGKLDEAIAAYRKAIELDPYYAQAHYNLGNTLRAQAKLEEAVAEYRKAIALQPDYAEAHCELGAVLLGQGELSQALDERRRGHELGSKRPGWPYPSAQWVRQAERLVELDAKLPPILKGETKPANTGECIELALMCLQCKHLNRAAAQLFARTFAERPQLADDLEAQHRYNAACAAALAGCGQGKDADQSDAKERTRLRRRALDWLRADLAAWGRLLEKEPKKVAPALAETMQYWQQDTDFSGVRGPEALARLPEAERLEWQKLWNEVTVLLNRARGKTAPEKK
jgi:tetratricopeptide (TPR) repeat protein